MDWLIALAFLAFATAYVIVTERKYQREFRARNGWRKEARRKREWEQLVDDYSRGD